MYKIKYLPLALKDLRDIIDYINETLKNPKAAMDLVDVLDKDNIFNIIGCSCKGTSGMSLADSGETFLFLQLNKGFYTI